LREYVFVRTTFDMPDELFRKAKARAAESGTSLCTFIVGAIQARLESASPVGWRIAFGKAPKATVREVSKIIDAEFTSIDLDSWR
jgi:hypothetical protein